MHPIGLLMLQWQGIAITPAQVWELLSLSESQVEEWMRSHSIRLKSDWAKRLYADKEFCDRNSINIIPFWHPNYPKNFECLLKPPLLVTCIGDSKCLNRPSVAIVGSRKMNFQTRQWMEQELTEFLKISNFQITSGGAYGVDQTAHKLAVLNSRPTICWLPSGLFDIYPNNLRGLVSEIKQAGGVLVSTYAPRQRMQKYHFVQRNQFIAAGSLFTFIVQAKRRSGTMITAKAAADFGKEVAVLPSAPNEEGLGGLDLISEGATLIRDSADLLNMGNRLMTEKATPLM